MSRDNIGHVLIAFVCCAWPLISGLVGAWIQRRITRRGLGSLIPHRRIHQ